MGKRYRSTILDEYQQYAGNATEGWAGDFREEMSDFIISYHLENNKMPSFSLIAENLIKEKELAELDVMYPYYLQLIEDDSSMTCEEYRETAIKLGLDYY